MDDTRHGFQKYYAEQKMPQSTGCMIYLFEILEKSSLIYSHRRQISSWIVLVVGVVENWLWALENFFGGGNILHLDGNSDCIGIHICLNSNYKLIASAFIICKLYFNKVNRVGRGYHGFCILPFQLNLESRLWSTTIPKSIDLLNILNKCLQVTL